MDDLIERLRANALDECDEAIDRLEELEAKGLANRVAIMKLEAKLAKAVEAANAMAAAIEDQIDIYDASEDEVVALNNYRTTLAELKGQNYE